MTSAPGNFRAFRFSLDDFPVRDRNEALREIYGRAILKLEFETKPDIPFTMDMQMRATPELGMSSGLCMPVVCRRTPQLIDSDDLVMVVALTGGGVFQLPGEDDTDIGPGQAVLTGTNIGSFNIHSLSRLINLRFSLKRMGPLIADFDNTLMKATPPNTEALRLLTSYVRSLETDIALAQPELRNIAVNHIYDLAALAVGATRDAAELSIGRGVKAARLQAIKADIVNNLGRPDLSLSMIAVRHGVTPRYVSMLFESEPETLSNYVLRQRLILAHRMLTDPRLATRTISSIAYDVGFGDVSYFNRVFRKFYGATPSDIRESALRGRS